eukprot:XP_011672742.1 PREDICTED: protein NYNRIN-like [Strongylocentrotus purpuratus]
MKDGVLVRRWESSDGKEISWKVVLPHSLRHTVLTELHSSKTACHLGVNKLLHKVQQRYYWVGLAADVRSLVRKCDVCSRLKNPPKKSRAPLQKYRIGATLERVAMDILGPLPETDRGNRYVLVIGDYFSKWIESYALPNQEARTVARVVVEEFICRYGIPRELHTDQGRNFESNLMKEVCEMLGIKKTRTCPLHPRSDGFIERFNRTLITMVSSILDPDRHQRDWDERIPYAMLAYRSAVQESTGESPAMMMLGREVTLPVDVIFTQPSTVEREEERGDYSEQLRDRIRDAHEMARSKLELAAEKQARMYDRVHFGNYLLKIRRKERCSRQSERNISFQMNSATNFGNTDAESVEMTASSEVSRPSREVPCRQISDREEPGLNQATMPSCSESQTSVPILPARQELMCRPFFHTKHKAKEQALTTGECPPTTDYSAPENRSVDHHYEHTESVVVPSAPSVDNTYWSLDDVEGGSANTKATDSQVSNPLPYHQEGLFDPYSITKACSSSAGTPKTPPELPLTDIRPNQRAEVEQIYAKPDMSRKTKKATPSESDYCDPRDPGEYFWQRVRTQNDDL